MQRQHTQRTSIGNAMAAKQVRLSVAKIGVRLLQLHCNGGWLTCLLPSRVSSFPACLLPVNPPRLLPAAVSHLLPAAHGLLLSAWSDVTWPQVLEIIEAVEASRDVSQLQQLVQQVVAWVGARDEHRATEGERKQVGGLTAGDMATDWICHPPPLSPSLSFSLSPVFPSRPPPCCAFFLTLCGFSRPALSALPSASSSCRLLPFTLRHVIHLPLPLPHFLLTLLPTSQVSARLKETKVLLRELFAGTSGTSATSAAAARPTSAAAAGSSAAAGPRAAAAAALVPGMPPPRAAAAAAAAAAPGLGRSRGAYNPLAAAGNGGVPGYNPLAAAAGARQQQQQQQPSPPPPQSFIPGYAPLRLQAAAAAAGRGGSRGMPPPGMPVAGPRPPGGPLAGRGGSYRPPVALQPPPGYHHSHQQQQQQQPGMRPAPAAAAAAAPQYGTPQYQAWLRQQQAVAAAAAATRGPQLQPGGASSFVRWEAPAMPEGYGKVGWVVRPGWLAGLGMVGQQPLQCLQRLLQAGGSVGGQSRRPSA